MNNNNDDDTYLSKDSVSSPKRTKHPVAGLKAATSKSLKSKVTATKRARDTVCSTTSANNKSPVSSEAENHTPSKKICIPSIESGPKFPVRITKRIKNAKSVVRNLEQSRELSPTPKKRSPLKSSKRNVRSPKKSAISLKKSPSSLQKPLKGMTRKDKQQLKMDSFIRTDYGRGVQSMRVDSNENEISEGEEDENRPLFGGSMHNITDEHVPMKVLKNTICDSPPIVPQNLTTLEKPAKLKIKRKQRSRR